MPAWVELGFWLMSIYLCSVGDYVLFRRFIGLAATFSLGAGGGDSWTGGGNKGSCHHATVAGSTPNAHSKWVLDSVGKSWRSDLAGWSVLKFWWMLCVVVKILVVGGHE